MPETRKRSDWGGCEIRRRSDWDGREFQVVGERDLVDRGGVREGCCYHWAARQYVKDNAAVAS